MGFKDTINPLDSSSSFYDWFVKENDEIIAKLNQANVANVIGGDGITAPVDSNGLATVSLSGIVNGGISFNGPVYFNNSALIPNIAIKINDINSTVGGFTFGTPVRVYYDISTGTNKYEAARGNDPDQAEVLGVVSEINANHAYVTMLGRISGDFTQVNARGIGLTAGWIYFLSPGASGIITDIEPTTSGYVSKPVIMGITGNEGLVLHMRGNYLNPDIDDLGISGGNTIVFASQDNLGSTLAFGITLGRALQVGDPIGHYRLLSNPSFTIPGSVEDLFKNFNKPYAKIAGSTQSLGGGIERAEFISFGSAGRSKFFSSTTGTRYFYNPGMMYVGILEKIDFDGSLYYYYVKTRGLCNVLPTNNANISDNVNVLLNDDFKTNTPVTIPLGNLPFNEPIVFSNLITSPSSLDQYNVIGRIINGKFYVENLLHRLYDTTNLSGTSQLQSSTTSNSSNIQYLINGNFNVWQRNEGKGLTYTSTGNVIFADMWRRHDGISGPDASKNYYIIRREFDEYQSDIEGSPEYYIDIKALGASAVGYTLAGTSYDFYNHLMVGHIVPDAKKFDNTYLGVKFYAKCSHSDYSADAYFSRYSGTQLLDYIKLGTLDLTTTWQSYSFSSIIPSLEDKGYSLDITNDYCEIGLDLIPLINTANENSIGITQNVYVSIASVSATSGNSSVPLSIYPDYEEQLKHCQKFYYSSYGKNDTIGSVTMLDGTNPTQNTNSIFAMPNKSCDIFKWPTEMRTDPTATIYSPYSGNSEEAYNKSANVDLRNTSGTIGYNSQIRSAPAGLSRIQGTSTKYGINVCLLNGFVNYDEIFYHVVADADFSI